MVSFLFLQERREWEPKRAASAFASATLSKRSASFSCWRTMSCCRICLGLKCPDNIALRILLQKRKSGLIYMRSQQDLMVMRFFPELCSLRCIHHDSYSDYRPFQRRYSPHASNSCRENWAGKHVPVRFPVKKAAVRTYFLFSSESKSTQPVIESALVLLAHWKHFWKNTDLQFPNRFYDRRDIRHTAELNSPSNMQKRYI